MKTEEEVQKLKFDWRRDPIWDIEETEGFEEFREELKKFSDECKDQWARVAEYKEKRSTKYNMDQAIYLIEQCHEEFCDARIPQLAQIHATLALVAELKRGNDLREGV